METDCGKCLHQKVCALWWAHERQDARCFSLDGCDCFEAAITPPNEPLTLDELREMDGEPVWFENMSGGRWCIVYADYHCLVGKMFGVTFEEAERTGRVYRRPPEGDEDHHG